MSKLDEFLAGERLEEVALFLTHDYLDDEGKIANYGEDVEDGVVLVVPGDDGRGMFAAGTGMDAMEFAQSAMGDAGEIHADLAVLDAVYTPLSTRLLRDADRAGATTVDGAWMLLYQGVEAFERWTGRAAPVDEMDAAVRSSL
ncbi:DUF5807 family protein [Halobium palmae]|uniref:DUF5807 family protein n=1 Tax=Halobium palmae TaxID=1776492 RepID=A0ABD5S3W8_9EURY